MKMTAYGCFSSLDQFLSINEDNTVLFPKDSSLELTGKQHLLQENRIRKIMKRQLFPRSKKRSTDELVYWMEGLVKRNLKVQTNYYRNPMVIRMESVSFLAPGIFLFITISLLELVQKSYQDLTSLLGRLESDDITFLFSLEVSEEVIELFSSKNPILWF